MIEAKQLQPIDHNFLVPNKPLIGSPSTTSITD